MKIPGRMPIGPMQQHTAASAAPQTAKPKPSQFDQIQLSDSAGSRFEMELKSRLSHEVRTATTTGRLSELTAQIKNGSYEIDPVAIARRMLMKVES